MIRAALIRFWSDRRGGALVDYALIAALVVTVKQVAAFHGAAIGATIAPFLPA